MKQLFFILTLSVSLISTPFAEGDVHQHGQANLNIVIDYPYVSLEFIAPAASLVGFEHEPNTDVEKNLVNGAIGYLKQHDLLSWYVKSGFFRQKSLIGSSVVEQEVYLKRDDVKVSNLSYTEHGHENHHHDHHVKQDHKDHDTHHGVEEQVIHSEFVLKARYKLISQEYPNLLSTSIFDSFESLDNLVVTLISNEQQQQYILTDVQNQIKL